MWREFGLIHSYTIECSFCGPTNGIYAGCHFNPTVMEILGRVFSRVLAEYTERPDKVKSILKSLQEKYPVE